MRSAPRLKSSLMGVQEVRGLGGWGGASKSKHARARRTLACHPVLPRARDTTGKQIPGGVTKKAALRADSYFLITLSTSVIRKHVFWHAPAKPAPWFYCDMVQQQQWLPSSTPNLHLLLGIARWLINAHWNYGTHRAQ